MHESTRRSLCRTGFILLCVFPTLGVLACAAVCNTPAYRAAQKKLYETRLSEQLGLTVTVESVARPSQGVTLLTGVKLSDPETGARLLSCRLVESARANRGWVVRASQPELDADRLPRLWELWHERLLRGRLPVGFGCQALAGEVTFKGAHETRTFTEVCCLLESAAKETRAGVDFRVAGLEMAKPAQFRVRRSRQGAPPATTWELHTPSTSLPCGLFAAYLPLLGGLGPECQFQGTLDATQTAAGWEGRVAGRLSNVDLDRLISERFPHRLSGQADIDLDAELRKGKVVEASGSVRSHGGTISRSLLQASERWLRCNLLGRDRVEEHCRYEELGLGFQLTEAGLAISGQCASASSGIVVSDGSSPPLLSDSHTVRWVPVANVARWLAPWNEIQVPATKQTEWLLSFLPLPPVIPKADQPAAPVPVRLGERK